MTESKRTHILKTAARVLVVAAIALVVALVFAQIFAPEVFHRRLFNLFAGRHLRVTIATGSEKGSYHRLGELMEVGLYSLGAKEIDVRATDGSLENIELVRSGAADFGLIQGALREDTTDLCALATLERQQVHILVPNDSPIRQFRDIAGKHLSFGPEKGGARALGDLVLDFCGLDPPPTIIDMPTLELEAALEEGRIDAVFTVFSLFTPVLEEVLARGHHRLVPLEQAQVLARYIPATFADVIPANAYGLGRAMPPAAGGPLPTLAVDTLLIARRDASPQKVEALLEAVYNAGFIKQARLTGLTEERGRQVVDLPLHAAAAGYYRRHDPISSDKFEIASFFLAGLIGLVSGVHFIMGRRQRRQLERRRQAIIPYFEELRALGTDVETASDPESLTALIIRMMTTQRRAEAEWLADRLDTEHMDNLYAVYSIRSRNAFSKMLSLQLAALRKEERKRIGNRE